MAISRSDDEKDVEIEMHSTEYVLDDFIRLYLRSTLHCRFGRRKEAAGAGGLADDSLISVGIQAQVQAKTQAQAQAQLQSAEDAAAPCCQMVVESRFHGQDRRGTPPKKNAPQKKRRC
jgi:hypothetical protein